MNKQVNFIKLYHPKFQMRALALSEFMHQVSEAKDTVL